MIEGAANEIPEEEFIKALAVRAPAGASVIAAQEELAAKRPARPKRACTLIDRQATNSSKSPTKSPATASRTRSTAQQSRARQGGRRAASDEVEAAIRAKFPEATDFEISQAFDYLQKKAFRV